jgi:hypothetical protein
MMILLGTNSTSVLVLIKWLYQHVICFRSIFLRSGQSSPWSYGSWIYNYLCNMCPSPLKLWVWAPFMARCSRSQEYHHSISRDIATDMIWCYFRNLKKFNCRQLLQYKNTTACGVVLRMHSLVCHIISSLKPNNSYKPITNTAPGFVNYKKGCTRLAAASDKVYQFLVQGRWFSPGNDRNRTK